jgi:hypothetical protein
LQPGLFIAPVISRLRSDIDLPHVYNVDRDERPRVSSVLPRDPVGLQKSLRVIP